MVVTLFGGASSGKSAVAENIAIKFGGKMAYVATMMRGGKETDLKITLHQATRRDKGFETIEKPCNIKINNFANYDTILIECMSNWLANEMFDGGDFHKIFTFVDEIKDIKENIIIVTSNIFGDGADFDKNLVNYMKILGEININLGRVSDIFLEIVAGVPVCLKGEDLYAQYI